MGVIVLRCGSRNDGACHRLLLYPAEVPAQGACPQSAQALHQALGCSRFGVLLQDWVWSALSLPLFCANGRKDDWDTWLPYTVFTINTAASTLGGDLTRFFIDRGQHRRLPRSLLAASRVAAGAQDGAGHDPSGGRAGDAADHGAA